MKQLTTLLIKLVFSLAIATFFFGCSPQKPPQTPREKLQNEIQDLEDSVRAAEVTLRESQINIAQKRENMPGSQ